ncbi:hypothetical protein, partial [Burkholderia territorii]|uniref:hypothetical protein n=1 Tax=Burkholderia territorii TaxID=1503055 RepID=UPI001BAC7C02
MMVTSGPARRRTEREAIGVARGNGCADDYNDRRARLPAIDTRARARGCARCRVSAAARQA